MRKKRGSLHKNGSVWVKVVDESLDDKDISLRYYTDGVSGRPDKEETMKH